MPANELSHSRSTSARRGAHPRFPIVLGAVWALLVLGLAAAAPTAGAAQSDAATTRAYIALDHRLAQRAVAKIPLVEATLRRVLHRVESECPGAATGSPQDPESTQLSNEVIGTMVTAVTRVLPRPSEYLSGVSKLRWSDGGLTRSVHGYAKQLTDLEALAAPNLCGDIRAWAAAGFTALPPTTRSFAPRFMAVWVGPGELPGSLSRFETSGERAMLAQTRNLESQFAELEAREVETWGKLMTTLGLWP